VREFNPDVKISATALKAIDDAEVAEHHMEMQGDSSLKPVMIPNVQPRELQDKKKPSPGEEPLSGNLKK
jgi:hypothetical protein